MEGRGDVCELKVRRLSDEDDDSTENLVIPRATVLPSAKFLVLMALTA